MFEKSCRLIRLIWSPLLSFVYSIVSIQSIIITFRHLDTILLPFFYWQRCLWSRLAPPTPISLIGTSDMNHFRTQPKSQCRWFVGQAVDFNFARRCSKRPIYSDTTELKSTSSWLEFSWVAINGPLGLCMTGLTLYAYAGFLSCLSAVLSSTHVCTSR